MSKIKNSKISMEKIMKKGFTLMELLVVIAMIGILASVVLVNLSGARQSTKNKAAFTQIISTTSLAYKCIRSSNTATLNMIPSEGGEICGVTGYSTWPVLVADSGWDYSDAGFDWCNPSDKAACSGDDTYANGTCGGNATTGTFCYKFINTSDSSKTITCTQNGCEKSGF